VTNPGVNLRADLSDAAQMAKTHDATRACLHPEPQLVFGVEGHVV
jgi:hypothetical protein